MTYSICLSEVPSALWYELMIISSQQGKQTVNRAGKTKTKNKAKSACLRSGLSVCVHDLCNLGDGRLLFEIPALKCRAMLLFKQKVQNTVVTPIVKRKSLLFYSKFTETIFNFSKLSLDK